MHNDSSSSFSEVSELVGLWAGRVAGIVCFLAVIELIRRDWEEWAKLPLAQRRRYNRFTLTLGAVVIPPLFCVLVWLQFNKATDAPVGEGRPWTQQHIEEAQAQAQAEQRLRSAPGE